MNGKLISILASLAFLAGCAQQRYTAEAPQLPPEVAKMATKCQLASSTRGGYDLNCLADLKGLTIGQADAVKKWTEYQNLLSDVADNPQPNFSLFEVVVTSGYPRTITTSRWLQKNEGYPKYVDRSGYDYHLGGRLGTGNVDRYNAHQEHSSCLQRQKWERNSGVRHPRRC